MTGHTIEETLRELEHRAALLRHFGASASASPVAPDTSALSGLADAAGELEARIRAVRRLLPAGAREIEMVGAGH